MANARDYYATLGLSRNASPDEIRKAYRGLARKLHPDVNKEPDAAERFSEVQEAYDVLSDDEKRKAYDQFGRAGVGASAGRPSGWQESGGGRTYTWTHTGDFGGADLGDYASIFEEFMGAGRTGFDTRTAGRRSSVPRKGADLHHTISIPFTTAAMGGREQVRLTSADGGSQAIEIKIPPAIESGTRMRVKGKGQPGPSGERGDLILTVNVGPHPVLRREGLDILIDLPITIAEAALGATVTVPLLEGTVELRVPPGTSSGQMLRIKGKGIEARAGRTGDFLAVVQIVAPDPEALNEPDRELLRRVGDRLKNPRRFTGWADKT